jgi:serine/threonine protein kinase
MDYDGLSRPSSSPPPAKRQKTEPVDPSISPAPAAAASSAPGRMRLPEGVMQKDVRHKDGSKFTVTLELHRFHDERGCSFLSAKVQRIPQLDDAADSEKMVGAYHIVKTIGRGSYGKVKLAVSHDSQLQVAIKTIAKHQMSELELERTRREIEIMKMLQHRNICQLYEVIETTDDLHLVMEYGGTPLLSLVMEKGGLTEGSARVYFLQLLAAINYCHERHIIHRDIKHQNILLSPTGQIKLIDFGLSNFIAEGKMRSTFCGTPAYAAPEMVCRERQERRRMKEKACTHASSDFLLPDHGSSIYRSRS